MTQRDDDSYDTGATFDTVWDLIDEDDHHKKVYMTGGKGRAVKGR